MAISPRSRTTPIVEQWRSIEKEIKQYVTEDFSKNALTEIGYKAMKQIADTRTFKDDTGNMMESIGFGVYWKGRQILSGGMTDGKLGYPPASVPYKVKSDKEIYTRYGDVISLTRGKLLYGKKVLEESRRNYQYENSSKKMSEVVVFGDMFYRFFLEDQEYLTGFLDMENYYARIATQSLRDFWNGKRVYSDTPVTAKPKGFKIKKI